MQVLRGHGNGKVVWGLAFSPDGSQLASSALDQTILLWDLSTGENRVIARGHTGTCISFSPAGDRLLSTPWGCVRIHDLAGGADRVLNIHRTYLSPPIRAAFASGGREVVVFDRVRRYDAGSLKELPAWPGTEHILPCLALGRDGRTLATAHSVPKAAGPRGTDHVVRLWKYPEGEVIATFTGAPKKVTALSLSPDGKWLAGTAGPTLLVWEVATGRVVLDEKPDAHHFQDVAFTPDSA